MSRLTEEQIELLADKIQENLPEKLYGALIQADTKGKLEELLNLLCMENLIETEEKLDTYSNGKIYVIGDTTVKEKDLLGVAKSLGLAKDRFNFIDFKESKKFNYKCLEWNTSIAAILIGAMPHKTTGSNDSSSAIAHMEKHKDRYPKVIRMTANNALKITKTNFKETISKLINAGVVTI